jgi:hypothetical protein
MKPAPQFKTSRWDHLRSFVREWFLQFFLPIGGVIALATVVLALWSRYG